MRPAHGSRESSWFSPVCGDAKGLSCGESTAVELSSSTQSQGLPERLRFGEAPKAQPPLGNAQANGRQRLIDSGERP